jgi:glutamine synthetase
VTAVAGPELEYYVCEPDPGSPSGCRRYGDGAGNVYTVGRTGDPDGHLLRALRDLRDLGLGVTMGNHEFSGGQFEINLDHSEALDAADRAFRFKAAVKEITRTEGRLATAEQGKGLDVSIGDEALSRSHTRSGPGSSYRPAWCTA